jgi:hypothetical protein
MQPSKTKIESLFDSKLLKFWMSKYISYYKVEQVLGFLKAKLANNWISTSYQITDPLYGGICISFKLKDGGAFEDISIYHNFDRYNLGTISFVEFRTTPNA